MNKNNLNSILLQIIKCYLKDEQYLEEIPYEELKGIYTLASKHSVDHLIGIVLSNSGNIDGTKMFEKSILKAKYNFARKDYEREQIYSILNNAEIKYLPLKGSVIKDLYPEQWQRTSCDIDILVHQTDLDNAVCALENNLGYCRKSKNGYHVSLISPQGVNLELHFDLDKNEMSADDVWACTKSSETSAMKCSMTEEMLVLHHIAHMAKHFRAGGCGVRPFIDLWIIDQKLNCDRLLLDEMLINNGLKRFYDVSIELIRYWFGNGSTNAVLNAIADFILPAGAYGNLTNRIAIMQTENNGKTGYFFSRLFLPYSSIKILYPILDKQKWLLPFCQVHRWIKALLDGRFNRVKKEIILNSSMDEQFSKEVGALLIELGL